MSGSPLFGIGYVADNLGVTGQAIWNWRRRYKDTPPPSAEVFNRHGGAQPVWDMDALQDWRDWYEMHSNTASFKKFDRKGVTAQ